VRVCRRPSGKSNDRRRLIPTRPERHKLCYYSCGWRPLDYALRHVAPRAKGTVNSGPRIRRRELGPALLATVLGFPQRGDCGPDWIAYHRRRSTADTPRKQLKKSRRNLEVIEIWVVLCGRPQQKVPRLALSGPSNLPRGSLLLPSAFPLPFFIPDRRPPRAAALGAHREVRTADAQSA